MRVTTRAGKWNPLTHHSLDPDASHRSMGHSIQSIASTGTLQRAYCTIAAYESSCVATRSSSSDSGSSSNTSFDYAVDPAKMYPASYKLPDAAAAEARRVEALTTDCYRYLYRTIPVVPPPTHSVVLTKYFARLGVHLRATVRAVAAS